MSEEKAYWQTYPSEKTSLDVYMQRLDVLCAVIETALQPGGRATKHDLRLLYSAAQKVVDAYQKEQKNDKPAS